MKNKSLKPYINLFLISISLVLILSMVTGKKYRLLHKLINNFFIVGVVFLSVGVIFQILTWSTHKKSIMNKPMDLEEMKTLKNSHKDAYVVSKTKRLDDFRKRKEIFDLLWKMFIYVGAIDFILSIVILIFW
ncbi:hypothetical protein NSA23_02990 [Anaerosalibacter massiliensis]|uniref:DUF3899 domain-containing protein n=1 Tax=Anaerosalibacter massiliensis TaxID=1347392 RepID=A0A9X2S431_9FIRM|nr:hypothetical protein [Anaerosalibacter massiliensis]MCR2043078.1 hypothetical protein [Anaerosalibacter massiliensis]